MVRYINKCNQIYNFWLMLFFVFTEYNDLFSVLHMREKVIGSLEIVCVFWKYSPSN